MRAQTQSLNPHQHARVSQIPASVRTLAERSTPTEIRIDIQKLLAQEQIQLAQALGDAGLALHPSSDEMLGICALLAMARSDWEESLDLLNQLQYVQGENTPATTFWLQARCHRCLGNDRDAAAALESGLMKFPASAELQAELTMMIKPEASA
jgi:hypothetical protein